MNSTIAIDRGNSSVKLSVFEEDCLVSTERVDALSLCVLEELRDRYDAAAAILSSVAGDDAEVAAMMKKTFRKCYILDTALPVPLEIAYSTPNTLGRDRVAAAVGASTLCPGRNLLIVDTGTAITLDVVTADGRFLGGNIAPGIQTRFASLTDHCQRLPLVNADGDRPLVGYDTVTAIRSGVVLGVVAEVEYMAAQLQKNYDAMQLLLTGGDANIIGEHLSPKFNFEIVNDLVAIGLNRILIYNEQL